MQMNYRLPDERNVRLSEFGPNDSIEELTRLLHRGYRSLAEMGFRYFASHQTPDDTIKTIAGATCLVAKLDQELVATATLRGPQANQSCSWYNRPNVASFGQFTVDPALRSHGLGRFLLDQIESLALAMGADELGLDTAEGAVHLIEWYGRCGFRFIEYAQWDVTNYRSVVMSKTLNR